MKKRIIIIISLILFLTGCSCTYNLKITDNTYSEELIIAAEYNNELNNLNQKWQIPVDKEEYNIGTDPSNNTINTKTYEYSLSNNKLSFKNDFTIGEYINSSAVSICYNKLTVSNYNDKTIISTSPKTICFDKNPTLNNIYINITVDKPVIKSNADSHKGNTYTWRLSRNNNQDKDINIVLDNSIKDDNDIDNSDNNKQNDYTMYIFAIILLFIFIIAYYIMTSIKSKEDEM